MGKILVTGCLSQRYQQQLTEELPEVDGVMGTGSYSRIVEALRALADGEAPRYFDSINEPVEELERVLTTPRYYAFLRIAEGCDNRCAFCVIPSLRGRYRSRRMEDVLAEAKKLAEAGVKEIIVIAQDITRYGLDLYGERKLAALLRELCRLDFHWVRLHYLYPDEFTPELLDTIRAKGVNIVEVTLHVGLGTFRPVSEDNIQEHQMHTEWYCVDDTAAEAINAARASGHRVIAVGTTSCRTLEAVWAKYGKIVPCSGTTDIFLYPGVELHAIDGLVTNFHLPESTLIMLISAFYGYEKTMAAYKVAVQEKYRFFSFGDAMFIQ